MADESKLTLTDFLSRFTDVANLSKIVTDIGPGFLIALSLLTFVNLVTGIPLLPIQDHARIQSELAATDTTVSELEEQIPALRKQRIEWHSELGALNATPAARGQGAELARAKEALTQRIADSQDEEKELRVKLVDAQTASKQLRTNLQKAGDLVTNLQLLEGHAVGVLFISLVLGVIFGQASGQSFYNDRYRKRFYQEKEKIPAAIQPLFERNTKTPADISYFRGTALFTEARKREYEALIKDYYRYHEIAMNMIVPTALLALAISAVSVVKITEGHSVYWLALVLVAALGAWSVIQLYRGAYDYYWHYRVKSAYFVKGLWDELETQGQQPTPAPSPGSPASTSTP